MTTMIPEILSEDEARARLDELTARAAQIPGFEARARAYGLSAAELVLLDDLREMQYLLGVDGTAV